MKETITPADAVKKVIDYLPVTGPILHLRKPVYDFEAIAQAAIQAYLASLPEVGPSMAELFRHCQDVVDPKLDRRTTDTALRALFAADKARAVAEKELAIQVLGLWKKAFLVDVAKMLQYLAAKDAEGLAYLSDCEGVYLEIEYRDWPLFPTAEEAVNDALAKRIAETEAKPQSSP